MKMTIDKYDLKEQFERYDRDYYSLAGCESLLSFYDDIDENMELDVIAICCDCSEYGNYCTLSFDDLIIDYGYKLDFDEWKEDNVDAGDDESEEEIKERYISDLVDELEQYTTVLRVDNGNYIIFRF